jgi:hypothetical protein
VCKSGHDRSRAQASYSILLRDKNQVADFFPKAVIRKSLDLHYDLKVLWFCYSIKKTSGREATGNQPP